MQNDQPIESPSEDRFGISSFTSALANSLVKMKAPTGYVVALNGPWGSGKSSAVNLVRHHLSDAVKSGDIAIIDFACWWFRGEEALALAFFRELYAGLSPSLGDTLKKSLPKLGARLLQAGAALGGAADLLGAGGAGSVAGGAMEWLGSLIEQDESVEKLHSQLAKTLSDQSKRFLIIIDDIDRLSPDEALLIFRLVKSVGRLPNVMYLLVYDRQLAEKVVSERFPSEGPHYLEKIVQATFELPEPMATDVQQHLLEQIGNICGDVPDERIVRFMNLFYEGVAPAMRTPRDVARFVNSLSVTWPSVADDVDPGDFIVLEVLRLLHADVYRAIRQNKDLLCNAERDEHSSKEKKSKECEELLLGTVAASSKSRCRRTLMRLFPALESIWGNTSYGSDFYRTWAVERRACSREHFDSYFRFGVGTDILTKTELERIIENVGNNQFIFDLLKNAINIHRPSGGTKAAVILSELEIHAEKIKKSQVETFLTALFSIADDIDVEADKAKAFGIGSNSLRLHWLLRSITRDRFTLEERSKIFLTACSTASLSWLADFTESAWHDYYPRKGEQPEPEDKCLTTAEDAEFLRKTLCKRIVDASNNGTLITNKDILQLLYIWHDIQNDSGASVKSWANSILQTDNGVKQIAKSCISYGWSQSMGFAGLGDLVAKRTTRVHRSGLEKILDVEVLTRRVEELLKIDADPILAEFLEAWKKADEK